MNKIMLMAAVLIPASITGCGEKKETPAVYTVRGEVKSLPSAADADIFIHHEAIPEFVNNRGKATGMMSMSMGFAPAKEVDISPLTVGEKIEFSFDVAWKRNPPVQLTSYSVLPADTVLTLEGM